MLLHGAGGGAVNWHRVLGPLAESFRVIAPDLPGCGESDKPKAGCDKPFYTRWLKGFLAALGIERSDLIGGSQGGAIALGLALANPDRAKRLVILNGAGLGKVGGGLIHFVRFAWSNTFPSERAIRGLVPKLVVDPANFPDELVTYGAGALEMPGGRRAFWGGKGKAISPFSDEELKRISVPTLLLWGRGDPMFPVSHAERGALLIPDSRLEVIEAAGHLPYLDQPDQVVAALAGFLSDEKSESAASEGQAE